MSRPAMWWTTAKGGRRSKRRPWKWMREDSRRAQIAKSDWRKDQQA